MRENLEDLLMRTGISMYDKGLSELVDDEEEKEIEGHQMFDKYKARNSSYD